MLMFFLTQINGKVKILSDQVLDWEGCDASAPGVAKLTDPSLRPSYPKASGCVKSDLCELALIH